MLKKIKEQLNWKRILRSEYLPLYVLFLIELLLHLTMGSYYGDDRGHRSAASLAGYFASMRADFSGWSSRIIINATVRLLYVMIDAVGDGVWAILNVLMILLLLRSVSEIFFTENKHICNTILACVFFFYPYSHMASAGWIATTVSYLWPAALAAYSCTLIKRVIDGEEPSLSGYVTRFLAAVYACSSEQLSIVMFVLAIASLGYCLKQKKRIFSLWMLTGIAFVNIIFHLTNGGNQNRIVTEATTRYPGYMMLSIVEKLQLGFSETLSQFIFAPNLVYLLLVLLICWSVWHKDTGIVNRVAVAMPLLFCVAFGFLPLVTANIFPVLWSLVNVTLHDVAYPDDPSVSLVTLANYQGVYAYLPIFVMLISFFITAVGLFLAIENPSKALMAALIFCCGVGSGMVMGFSPTIYASQGRIYLYTYICFIISIVIVFHENLDLFTRRGKGYFVPALVSISSISLLAQAFGLIQFYSVNA